MIIFAARFFFAARSVFGCARLASLALCFAFILAFTSPPILAAESPARALFPRIAELDLPEVRALATLRAPEIALAGAKVGAAQADLAEQRKRLKLNSAGGLDPFGGKIRFYLALDLERLLQLNGAAREKARRIVESEQIGQTQAQNAVTKTATVAWYDLRRALANDLSARRRAEVAAALYVAADARFKAGGGELSGVLGALSAQSESADAIVAATQAVALASLDVAQACGYPTAEAMEADLRAPAPLSAPAPAKPKPKAKKPKGR